MDQPTFSDLEYQGKKRKTRRELFLERMDSLIPSDGKRPAVVIDEHSVICEWEPDMNHTDQIAKLLERL